MDVGPEEGSGGPADHPQDSRWKLGVLVGCTEHDECSEVTAWEQVAEEEDRERAGQTQRRWTTKLKVATEGRTLVEGHQMAVVTQVAEA